MMKTTLPVEIPASPQRPKLKQLGRHYTDKYPNWSYLVQFLIVGMSGALVNLAVMTALLAIDVSAPAAVRGAIVVSMFSNFLLNRRFTFSYARHGSVWRQFIGFMATCLVGAVIQYLTTLRVLALAGSWLLPQGAALVGIAAGTVWNFLLNRYLVFLHRPEPARSA